MGNNGSDSVTQRHCDFNPGELKASQYFAAGALATKAVEADDGADRGEELIQRLLDEPNGKTEATDAKRPGA